MTFPEAMEVLSIEVKRGELRPEIRRETWPEGCWLHKREDEAILCTGGPDAVEIKLGITTPDLEADDWICRG